jgi:methyltransferase family protein
MRVTAYGLGMIGNVSDIALLIVLLVPLALVFLIVLWGAMNGIGPSPTTAKQKRALFAALPDQISGNIYELGSGWGGLAIALARRYPNCCVIGVENSPIPFLYSLLHTRISGLPNLHLHWKNIQEESLENPSLIVCYLHTGAMRRLKSKLEQDLHGDTWIVSNTFSFHGWDAVRTVEIHDLYHSRIYVYRK